MRLGEFRAAAAVAVAMALATALVAWVWHLPVRDPDGVSVPTWIRLPLIVLTAVLADVVVRWLALARAGVGRREAVAHLRERWGREQVVFTISGLVAWYVAYVAFRNLKSYVPFVNRRLWDDQLARLDKVLFLGQDPAGVLHDILGTHWAAWVLTAVYLLWIGLLPATLAIALVWTRRSTTGEWFVTAISLDWLLGVAAYYLLPTLGPVYADPAQFADIATTPNTEVQQMLMDDRVAVLADPWAAGTLQTIAAFASLHVGMMMTICLIAELVGLRRGWRISAWVVFVLTVLSTIYLGWHFSVDAIGGVVLGAAGVWLAALATGNNDGLRPRLAQAETERRVDFSESAGSRA